jgi:hypothetical protein
VRLDEKIAFWRERFDGRSEVFGRKKTYFSQKENRMVSDYHPVYLEKYASKKSREGVSFSNPGELYVELTDADVSGHITGVAELLIYVLKMDATCKFFAMDFDTQHGFEDVLLISNALDKLGFPHGIARSTTKGHHIYGFLEKPIEAKYITSLILHIYEEVGFQDRLQQGELGRTGKPWSNPEVFPKTVALGDAVSTGYGIKPPMHGSGMQRNQNCWVDKENKPIGGSGNSPEQWEYFKSISVITIKHLLGVIETNEIPVSNIRLSEKRGAVQQRQYKRITDYKPPTDGDFMLVVKGCPALKRLWEGSNKDMSHEARVAMLSMALRTSNGISLLRERFGASSQTEEQIQYAIDTGQHPWTCAAMAQYGICIKGRDPAKTSGTSKDKHGGLLSDHCFEKVAPRETIEGKIIVNPGNLPESEWPEPSPIRLRIPFSSTGINGVKEDIDKLTKDDPSLSEKLDNIFRKIVSLKDAKNRAEVVEYLKAKKLTTVANIKAFEKDAKKAKREETDKQIQESDGFKRVNGHDYALLETDSGIPAGYGLRLQGAESDSLSIKELCNFVINFNKDLTKHSISGISLRMLEGTLICQGKYLPFRISAEDWSNNSKLSALIYSVAGIDAAFNPVDLSHIRCAVTVWGNRELVIQESYEDYGYDSLKAPSVYRSTEYNITANGFTTEDNSFVDMSDAGYAKGLMIKQITNEEFSSVIHVIKKDLIPLQSSYITMTILAHSLQSVIHNVYLPFPESPILWVQGLTGGGKSAIAKLAQSFHGNFPTLMNIQTTTRALEDYTMMFKDSLFVIDDYKEAFSRTSTIQLIQKIYDRSERGRLTVNLKQGQTRAARGLVMITAEDSPTSESSAIARLVLIESNNKVTDSAESQEAFRRIKAAEPLFCGITGRFIQYMLQNYPKPEVLHEKFFEHSNLLIQKVRNMQNSNRIVNNLAANYLTWEIFLEFLMSNGVLTKEEFSKFRQEHWENVQRIRDSMIELCGREQASNVFLDVLKEALNSGKFKLDGLGDNPNADVIGFVDPTEPDAVYLFPTAAVTVVKRRMRELGAGLSHSKESIGKQLAVDGLLLRQEDGRTTCRKVFRGQRNYVWGLSAHKTGLNVMANAMAGSVKKTSVHEDDLGLLASNNSPLPLEDIK